MPDGQAAPPVTIAACLKWVPTRPEIDPLTGTITTDERFSGLSPADRAALEWALRVADVRNAEVVAISVGSAAADAGLREAMAHGASSAYRIHCDEPHLLTSRDVARGLASACGRASLVFCGNHSLDRGSGSVPAFVAHELGFGQALGCVGLECTTGGHIAEPLVAERRLDQGRRERLSTDRATVLSFEGGQELRRAPLGAAIGSPDLPIHVRELPSTAGPGSTSVVGSGPFRPRARMLAAPDGSTPDRIKQLTGVDRERPASQQLELDADEAAETVLNRLREWGYLDDQPAAD